MTLRRTHSRQPRRAMVAALAVALSVSFTVGSAGMANAVDAPSDDATPESPTALTSDAAQAAVAAATEPGTFVSLTPERILDTRAAIGAPGAPVAANDTISLQVTGRGGVPASGVAAIVVNVTVTAPTAAGFITVYPTSAAGAATVPTASNLNFAIGQNVPNLVTVKIGADGKIDLANASAGTTHLIADVAGYYLAGEPVVAPGAFVSVDPTRILDTREGIGAPNAPVGADGTVDLQVTGAGGLPVAEVAAVVLNVTVTAPTSAGFLTVYPSGPTAVPTASNLNFTAGQNIPNLVTVKVGADGKIRLTNSSAGTAELIADVAGYYIAGPPTATGAFVSVEPTRVLDTRIGLGAAEAPVAASGIVPLQVTARGAVPSPGVAAVVVNVTVTEPAKGGFVTVYPFGTSQPTASNLNFTPGLNVPNLAAVKVGGNGKINLANNSAGTVELIADIAGYFIASPDELARVWPTGWISDECGTANDSLLLLDSPGIVYSPLGTPHPYKGEEYSEFHPESGNVIVTASAESGYVMIRLDSPQWVKNTDGSITGTIPFTDVPCP